VAATEQASAPTADPRGPHADGARQEADRSLNRTAGMATGHCLIGCAAGEVSGMGVATALGWGSAASISLAVVLAFVFGYALTAIPLVRSGLAVGAVVTTALASDTLSIATMEAIDNLFVALVPGAVEAGLGDWLLWAAIAGGFAVAFPVAFLANRALIARGKGPACAG
jgi:hypothetical protein